MNFLPNRREAMQLGAAGVLGFSFSNALPLLAARAAETGHDGNRPLETLSCSVRHRREL